MAMTETDSRATGRTPNLLPRDARGRFVARSGATLRARVAPSPPRDAPGRARSLPSRDARGRFVAFPTTSAPSWCVFCADGYRIPDSTDVNDIAVDARPAPQPQPPARVAPRCRPRMQWGEIATWILIAIFVVAIGWHG